MSVPQSLPRSTALHLPPAPSHALGPLTVSLLLLFVTITALSTTVTTTVVSRSRQQVERQQ